MEFESANEISINKTKANELISKGCFRRKNYPNPLHLCTVNHACRDT